MAQRVVFIAALLLVAESKASDMADRSTPEAFLSKFVTPNFQSVKHGNRPDALSYQQSPAEHGPVANREVEQAMQKLAADGNSNLISLSIFGAGLLSFVTMLGLTLRQRFASAADMPLRTALVDNVMEMKAQEPHQVNSSRVGWGQLSSRTARQLTLARATEGRKAGPIPRNDGLETLPMAKTMVSGTNPEFGGKIFDPLGFATFSEESLTWFRACELKHSRVAMLASAGWIVNELHISLPGTIDYETKFSDLAQLGPFDAWEKVPVGGKLQILGWIFCVECASEMQKPHYLKGGEFVTYDWANLSGNMSDETFKRKQAAELKNGRLAMIGILSFVAAQNIPGSVPTIPH
jgi:hypothetical protein